MNLSYPRYLTRYFRKNFIGDCCDLDETLADTEDRLSDTTDVTSKLTGVKFRKSPGNINYSTFPQGWTRLCNIHRGEWRFKLFQRGVVLQAIFLPGNWRKWRIYLDGFQVKSCRPTPTNAIYYSTEMVSKKSDLIGRSYKSKVGHMKNNLL